MNGPNTRGLLGKGLSAPVTPAVFGPFMPGACSLGNRTIEGSFLSGRWEETEPCSLLVAAVIHRHDTFMALVLRYIHGL